MLSDPLGTDTLLEEVLMMGTFVEFVFRGLCRITLIFAVQLLLQLKAHLQSQLLIYFKIFIKDKMKIHKYSAVS